MTTPNDVIKLNGGSGVGRDVFLSNAHFRDAPLVPKSFIRYNKPIMSANVMGSGKNQIYSQEIKWNPAKKKWELYFGGTDNSFPVYGGDQIYLAESDSYYGPYTKMKSVLNRSGANGEPRNLHDDIHVNDCSVIHIPELGITFMAYTSAGNNGYSDSISFATAPLYGDCFTKNAANPFLTPPPDKVGPGTFWTVARPAVMYEDGKIKVWYDRGDYNSAPVGAGGLEIWYTEYTYANGVFTQVLEPEGVVTWERFPGKYLGFGGVDVKKQGNKYILTRQIGLGLHYTASLPPEWGWIESDDWKTYSGIARQSGNDYNLMVSDDGRNWSEWSTYDNPLYGVYDDVKVVLTTEDLRTYWRDSEQEPISTAVLEDVEGGWYTIQWTNGEARFTPSLSMDVNGNLRAVMYAFAADPAFISGSDWHLNIRAAILMYGCKFFDTNGTEIPAQYNAVDEDTVRIRFKDNVPAAAKMKVYNEGGDVVLEKDLSGITAGDTYKLTPDSTYLSMSEPTATIDGGLFVAPTVSTQPLVKSPTPLQFVTPKLSVAVVSTEANLRIGGSPLVNAPKVTIQPLTATPTLQGISTTRVFNPQSVQVTPINSLASIVGIRSGLFSIVQNQITPTNSLINIAGVRVGSFTSLQSQVNINNSLISINGLVTGLFILPQTQSKPSVAAASITGNQSGSFLITQASTKPIQSLVNVFGLCSGSFQVNNTVVTPDIKTSTITGVEIISSIGSFPVINNSITVGVNYPVLVGVKFSSAIRAPSGDSILFKDIYGNNINLII